MYNKLVAELLMGRVCMGRVGYGPSLSWAEFVMGRDVQLPTYMILLQPSYKLQVSYVLTKIY